MSVREIMSMIYAFSIRHNLNWQTIESLTVLIKTIIGDSTIPHSKYHFKKLFCFENEIKPTVHFNCHACKNYLGTESELKQAETSTDCDICGTEINLTRKYRDRHFFISIPLESQLERHIQEAIRNNELKFRPEANEDHIAQIKDVFDGDLYKNLAIRNENKKFVTLTLNTDGAVVFRATRKSSIWPLQFYVNEIKQRKRFQRENILISTIAFGGTPDMNCFLKPFLEEVCRINLNGGINVVINGQPDRILIIPHLWTLDSVAKCDVMNKVQYNGYNGCPYCFHPGTKIANNCVRYSNADNGADRFDSDTRGAMRQANETGERVRGYRGLSPLYVLPNFDLNWQIVIDKMHNIDLGVVKKMFDLFLSPSKQRQVICENILILFLLPFFSI